MELASLLGAGFPCGSFDCCWKDCSTLAAAALAFASPSSIRMLFMSPATGSVDCFVRFGPSDAGAVDCCGAIFVPGISGVACCASSAEAATPRVRVSANILIFILSPGPLRSSEHGLSILAVLVMGERTQRKRAREPHLSAICERNVERSIRVARPLGLLHSGYNLVVLFRWQYTHKGHHPLHEPTPVGAQAEVLGLFDQPFHVHHGTFHISILREVRNVVSIRGCLTILGYHAVVAHIEGIEILLLQSAQLRALLHLLVYDAHHAGIELRICEWAIGSGCLFAGG